MCSFGVVESDGDLFGEVPFEVDVLPHLESDLEETERGAMAFLLYDDIPVAQQKLFIMHRASLASDAAGAALSATNFLHEWALSERFHWREKVVEALLIIKAHSNVKKLLLDVDEMKKHFFSQLLHMSLFINPMKKVLLNISESLLSTEVKVIIENIRKDCIKKNITISESLDDKLYMWNFELYLMELLTHKYITLSEWHPNKITQCKQEECDMSNLINILKDVGYQEHAENVKYSQDKYNNEMKGVNKAHTSSRSPTSTFHIVNSDDNSNKSSQINFISKAPFSESIYPIYNPKRVGYVFIINQIKFDKNQNFPATLNFKERIGSEADEERLKNTWKKFGFKAIARRNLKAEDILFELKFMLTSTVCKQDSAFVLCILSHGKKGVIMGSDCKAVSIEAIEELFNTSQAPKLAEKPKILLLQSCQGDAQLPTVNPSILKPRGILQHDGPVSSVPEKSDLFRFYSTVANFESFRDTEEGSWFIQSLCDQMDNVQIHRSESFDKICTGVTRDVSRKRFNDCAQMPEKHSTFTKDLYLTRISD